MKKLVLVSMFLSQVCFAFDGDYEESVSESKVSYMKTDGSASASLSIMEPKLNLSTTKEYAQYVMDSHMGWDLQPLVDLRGFTFKYVDNAPCSAIVTFFDGRNYLLFEACGTITDDELASLYKSANKKLKLDEILKRQSHATTY